MFFEFIFSLRVCLRIMTLNHYTLEPYRLFDVRGITGTGNDSLEEQLRKERMRLFFSGVTAYEWVKR